MLLIFACRPLRERKEDILPLTSHFIKKYRTAFKKDIEFIPDEIIDLLLKHSWPGNIRELENVIQRAVLLSKDNTLSVKDFDFSESQRQPEPDASRPGGIDQGMYEQPLKTSLAKLEGIILEGALKRHNGRVPEVVEKLEIGKTALYSKMKKYGITPKEMKD